MSAELAQAPCPRCGTPRAEWIENDGAGVSRGDLVFCSERCADEDARPASLEQGDTNLSTGPAAGPAEGPEAAGSPAQAPSPPSVNDPRAGGPRPEARRP